MFSPSTLLHERYRIAKVHEFGHENIVYLAHDEVLRADVAVKENGHQDPAHQDQFQREALFLANLDHPNIPKAFDYFIEDDHQFFAMDYIEGINLKQLMHQRKPGTDEILDWAARLCDILAYLHSSTYPHKPTIIHQDIEPSNIILARDGQVFLVDFGFAKIYKPEGDRLSIAKPSIPRPPDVEYTAVPDAQMARIISPIIMVDRRSDQYSLAATLYALLTGASPPDSMERINKKTQVAPIRSFRPDLPPSAEEAILRALSLDQNRRFSIIEDFKSALGILKT